jgi:hypothetical protein
VRAHLVRALVILRCAEYEPFHPAGVKKMRRPSVRRAIGAVLTG